MQFWLGTHMPQWLGLTDVPLMISHRQLVKRKRLPRALGPWVLDSGGYSELAMFGEWRTTPAEYVRAVRRYEDETGALVWAAPQDWTCDPGSLAATGLTLDEHQRLTTVNFARLHGEGPFVPVLQGWTRDDYMRHVALYDRVGVDLAALPIVGLGSIASRHNLPIVFDIADDLRDCGIALHGFGLKRGAIRAAAGHLFTSIDSMAWSMRARFAEPLPGCTHKQCQNCLPFALAWRAETLAMIANTKPYQRRMMF